MARLLPPSGAVLEVVAPEVGIVTGARLEAVVTTAPYYGLRDYGHPGQIGFLFKQHGEWLATEFCDDAAAMLPSRRTVYVSPDGSYVPLGEVVDFFGGAEETAWVGKKAAGRLLDGRTHDEFPA